MPVASELPHRQWSLPPAAQSRESSVLPWSVEKLRLIAITLGVPARLSRSGQEGSGCPVRQSFPNGDGASVRRWPSRCQTRTSSGSWAGALLNARMKSTALEASADAVKMNLGSFSRTEIHDLT